MAWIKKGQEVIGMTVKVLDEEEREYVDRDYHRQCVPKEHAGIQEFYTKESIQEAAGGKAGKTLTCDQCGEAIE